MTNIVKAGLAIVLAACIAVLPQIAQADKPTYARKMGVQVFRSSTLEHTYVCTQGKSTEYCYSQTGRSSGGSKLADSEGTGDADVPKCFSKCTFVWGVHGTCHQESNLMLIDTGKTVHTARGYAVSVAVFGTYGTALVLPCINKCKDA